MPDLNKASLTRVLFLVFFCRRKTFLILWVFSQAALPWKHKELYWESSNIGLSVASPELERPLLEAMNIWNSVPCLKFRLGLNPSSSNQVGFKSGALWPYETDALGMTIYKYEGFSKIIDSVQVELNHANRHWRYTDYKNVLLHELGHVLGLEHSNEPTAVMWPYARLGDPEHTLSQDDIEGACRLKPVLGIDRRKGPMLEQRVPEKSGCSQSSPVSIIAWLVAGLFLGIRRYVYRGKTAKNMHGE